MMKNSSKKLAFTIAEILLAMVILGIIFLLSVNTLQHSSQDREKSSQLMKLYPIMDNMISLIVLENMGVENIPFGEGDGTTDKFSQMLVKKLRVGENCQKNKDGCWATVADIPEDISDFYKVRLVDGTALAITTFQGEEKCTKEIEVGDADDTKFKHVCMLMYVDVNALDKPNKWQEDVFKFVYDEEEGFQPASIETMRIVEKPKESTK